MAAAAKAAYLRASARVARLAPVFREVIGGASAAAAFAAAPQAGILETEGAEVATGVPAAVVLAECAREALKALGMATVSIDPAARTLFFGCGFGDDEGRPGE